MSDKLEKVAEEVKIMSQAIETELNFDTQGAGMLPENIYEKLLPEDISLDTVKRVQTHNLDFADAVSLATGVKGTSHLKDHPELDSVSVKIKMGNDSVATDFQRSVERRNPGTGETFQKPGVLSTKYTTGIGSSRGNYKKIQEHVSEYAASVFNQ